MHLGNPMLLFFNSISIILLLGVIYLFYAFASFIYYLIIDLIIYLGMLPLDSECTGLCRMSVINEYNIGKTSPLSMT